MRLYILKPCKEDYSYLKFKLAWKKIDKDNIIWIDLWFLSAKMVSYFPNFKLNRLSRLFFCFKLAHNERNLLEKLAKVLRDYYLLTSVHHNKA